MKICGIYCIENKINKKKYIGQSFHILSRFCKHKGSLNRNKHYNPYLQSAWNKYGESNFEFKILCEEKEENLNELEMFVIELLETFTDKEKGYNLTAGGEGQRGYEHSEESKEKNRIASTGVIFTEERREKIRIASTGNKNWLNKERSEETKQKLRLANIGKKQSEETKEKIRISSIGKNLGKKHSEEAKEKNSIARKQWWVSYWSKTVGC